MRPSNNLENKIPTDTYGRIKDIAKHQVGVKWLLISNFQCQISWEVLVQLK